MRNIVKKVLVAVVAIGMLIVNVGIYTVTATEINDNTVNDASVLQVGYKGNLTLNVEMRILPSINSSVIATLGENTEFSIIDIMNKWCHIEAGNYTGWVLLSKLGSVKEAPTSENTETTETNENTTEENTTEQQNTDTSESTTTNTTKYVSVDTLNVRETAENDGKIIDQVSINDEVTVTEEIDGWSKIDYNGKTGYVASRYLSASKTEVTSRSEQSSRKTKKVETYTETAETETSYEPVQTSEISSESGNSVVDYAKQFLGYRYVSGGSSPSTGFDCSGFTSYVYSHFGVSLSRTTSGQNSNGTYVDRSNLQAGDILVFRNRQNTSVGHVGIYIGGDSFIHSGNTSTGVCIGSMSSSYYSTRYVGARRVLN